jgi:LysM repeat protein
MSLAPATSRPSFTSSSSRTSGAASRKPSTTSAPRATAPGSDPSRSTATSGNTPQQTAQQQTEQQQRDYTVKKGDTLSHIAKRHGVTLNQLLQDNPQFRANPDLIFPGQKVSMSQASRAPIDGQTRRPTGDVAPGTHGRLTTPGDAAQAKAAGGVAPSSSAGRSSPLMDLIASGEGGYNSMNQGTRNGRIVGSTHNASSKLGKNLTDMTVGEVMQHQRAGRLFAAGKYQVIPSTMRAILPKSGLSPSDRFDAAAQEKLGRALIQHKRPYAHGYLTGQHNDRTGAMRALAKEWASLPDPRTGSSYYGSGNRSSHTVAQVAAALDRERSLYAG